MEHFNKFFTEIGTNIQNKILPTNQVLYRLSPKSRQRNFFITPTTDDEISDNF